MRLTNVGNIDICPRPPFSFLGTFVKPSHFPTKLVTFDGTNVFQCLRIGDKLYGVKMFDATKNKKRPVVRVAVYSKKCITSSEKEEIKKELTYRYNLEGNLSLFAKRFSSDPLFAGPLKRWRGMRPSNALSLYELLIITVVLQNTVVRRSIQMMDNLLNRFGTTVEYDGMKVFALWQPKNMDNVTEEYLRSLKIGYRAKIVKRISTAFSGSTVDEMALRQLTQYDAVKDKLLDLYGVGPQTVGYILFEAFHFYQLGDHISPWESKILSHIIFGHKNTRAEKIISYANKKWGQWAMLALHYLFEDVFWLREKKRLPWLDAEIRM